jgi:transcriptional regulator with XRE-family HTH domain
MTMSANREWIDRQQKTMESRRDYEYERLAVLVLDELYEAMERSNLTKADIARALGTSRANITQVFSGSRNLTLRTLSDLAWACGARLCLKTEPLRSGDYISSPVMIVEPKRRVVNFKETTSQRSGNVCDDAIELLA